MLPRPLLLLRDPRLSSKNPRRRRTRSLSRYVPPYPFAASLHSFFIAFLLLPPSVTFDPPLHSTSSRFSPTHIRIQADQQDKVEKTKVEGKGFFAKFFGSKEKSPKKQKVKTPKVSFLASFPVRADVRSRSLTLLLPRPLLPSRLPKAPLLLRLPLLSRPLPRSLVPPSLPILPFLPLPRLRLLLFLLPTSSLRSSLPRMRKLSAPWYNKADDQ